MKGDINLGIKEVVRKDDRSGGVGYGRNPREGSEQQKHSKFWIPIHPVLTNEAAHIQNMEEATLEKAMQKENLQNAGRVGTDQGSVFPSISHIQELLNLYA